VIVLRIFLLTSFACFLPSIEFGLLTISTIVKPLPTNLFLTHFGELLATLLHPVGSFTGSMEIIQLSLFHSVLRLFCIDRFAFDLVRKRRETLAATRKENDSSNEENEETKSGYRDLLSLYIEKGWCYPLLPLPLPYVPMVRWR
jgi:hypothetical protein